MKTGIRFALGALILGTACLASADCKDCGTVAEVRPVTKEMIDASPTAKNPIDKGLTKAAKYQVVVKMDSGKMRGVTFINPPEYKVGDKVKFVEGFKLTRQ